MRDLKPQWERLAQAFQTPLLQYEWFVPCAELLCQPGHLRIVVNHSQRGITALAPLVSTKQDGLERLEVLGAAILDEPTGFIYSNEESLRELISALLRMGLPLLFRGLDTGSPEAAMLCKFNSGLYFLRNQTGSAFLDIRAPWDEFLAGMTSDNRNHLRRKRKELDKHGKIAVEIITPDADNVVSCLDEIVRVEAAGWKGDAGTAMSFDHRLKHFFSAYSNEMARRGCLRFCTLSVDGKPVAVQLAVQHSNRFWLLKVGYDAAWRAYSPGVLLTHETIRHAFQQRLDGYEFLGHDEPWIHRWTRQTHAKVTVRSYPYSFRGIGTFTRDSFHSILNKMSRAQGSCSA